MQQTTKDHSITIFVHGTYPIRPLLEWTPLRSFIYCSQGLHLAKDLPKQYHFYQVAKGCIKDDSDYFTWDQFYIFGWSSEKVSHQNRMQSAKQLIKELDALVNQYYINHHVVPKIRLIGFSHGGNVILNTDYFLPLYCHYQRVVFEVWLFGVPVQKINKNCVNSPYFSRVYSIFSQSDWIQRIDPQGLNEFQILQTQKLWSDRMFDVQDKCIQVQFTVNERPIGHVAFRKFFKYFSQIKHAVEKQHMLSKNKHIVAVNLHL